MTTNYPGALDSYVRPQAGDPLNNPSHSEVHDNVYDAIEALEAELGINPRGAYASVVARLNAVDSLKVNKAGDTMTGTLTVPNLTLSNPGIGNTSTINFAKTSDTAQIRVTEYSSDQTRYEFYMSDNPDQAQDLFLWRIDDYQGDGGDWTPLSFSGRQAQFIARQTNYYGNLAVNANPFHTGVDGSPNTVLEIKTGTTSLTVNSSGYSHATNARVYWVKVDGTGTPNTFRWGIGAYSSEANTQATLVPITGSTQTLDNGVTITFSSTTGAALGDVWQWTTYPSGKVTARRVEATEAVTVNGSPVWTAANGGAGSGLDADLLDGQQGTYFNDAANLTGTIASARLAGSYTGITGVGTITSGTWTGTTIAAANGGTGHATYAIGDLLQANSPTTLSRLAAVATGNALISGGVGAASTWGKVGLTTHVSGVLPVASGGTNIASYTTNNYLRAQSATVLEQRTPAQVLTDIGGDSATNLTTGTVPSARMVGSYTSITGVGTITAGVWTGTAIAAANGGTGITSYTTGNYINASGATTLQQRTPAQVLADIGAASSSHNHDATYVLKAGDTMTGLLTLSGDPTNALHAASKQYVDAIASGAADVKASVRCATTVNITLSGLQAIDGVTVVASDRVLVKNQSTASQNGLYSASASAWTRTTDADTSAEVTAGLFTFVTEGTTQANSGWLLTTNDTITLGTTSLTFAQFTGAGQIDAGAGLTKSGNTLDVGGTTNRITVNADTVDIAATYVGQTSITTLGTIATGTWQGTTIAANQGGTGIASYTANNFIRALNSTTLEQRTPAQVLTDIAASPLAGSASIVTVGTITSGIWTGTAIAAANGGTGNSTYAVGDLLQATAATTLSRLAAVATGNVLISGGVGVASSWGKVGLTTHVTGVLPVANGGTNIASYTTNNFLRAQSATVLEQRTPAQVLTDIAASPLAGSASIVTVGTITSGTWQGTTIAANQGGTGIASYTTGNYLNAASGTTLQQRTPAQVLSDIGAAASGHNHDATYVNKTGDSMSGALTLSGDPSSALHATTKQYVDAAFSGADVKASVRIGTLANHGLTGLAAIDGVTPVANDRVLVKNQSTGAQNGIYTAASGAWTRATDADTSAEVTAGMYTFITEGGQANTGWLLTTNDPITLGTTALVFVQFTGAGDVTAGNGLDKTGNTLSVLGTSNRITVGAAVDIASTYVGQTSITTLGTISTGTWQGTTIAANQGGTGLASYTTGNYLNASSSSALQQRTPAQVLTDIAASPLAGSASLVTVGTIATGTWNATTIAANKGGTGQATYAVGDLVQATAATTMSRLAAVATGNVLISGGVGVASSWGKVGLTTHVSGTLPVANGGTNLASYTTNSYLRAQSATVLEQRTPAQVLTDINGVSKSGDSMTGSYTILGDATISGNLKQTTASLYPSTSHLVGVAANSFYNLFTLPDSTGSLNADSIHIEVAAAGNWTSTWGSYEFVGRNRGGFHYKWRYHPDSNIHIVPVVYDNGNNTVTVFLKTSGNTINFAAMRVWFRNGANTIQSINVPPTGGGWTTSVPTGTLVFDGANTSTYPANDHLTFGKVSLTETPTAATHATPKSYVDSVAPIGGVIMWVTTTNPTGWLTCDGANVSRTTYAALFAAIGTTWGTGDGSTTFTLPDLRGRTPIGDGQGTFLTNRTMTNIHGEETVLLTSNELPSHSHVMNDTIRRNSAGGPQNPGHSLGVISSAQPTPMYAVNDGAGYTNWSRSTNNAGSGATHENMQPSLVVRFIIRAL